MYDSKLNRGIGKDAAVCVQVRGRDRPLLFDGARAERLIKLPIIWVLV